LANVHLRTGVIAELRDRFASLETQIRQKDHQLGEMLIVPANPGDAGGSGAALVEDLVKGFLQFSKLKRTSSREFI